MKFGLLILGKIFKFVATGCDILRLKCTKFNLDLLAGFKGPTFKGGEGKGCRMGGEERDMEGTRRQERGGDLESWFTPLISTILKNTLIAELI